MDQGRRRKDRLYRARVTLGERLLRELQRPFQGRALEWGDILYPDRRSNRDRAVETAYDTKRPHSAIGYRPSAPESVTLMDEKRIMLEISNRTKPWGYLNISIHSMNYDNFRTEIHNIEILNKNNYL